MGKSIQRDYCFLCTTPLQLLGAIAIRYSVKGEADIYLFDDFNKYDEVGRKLRETGLFDHVYCVDFYSSLKTKNKKLMRMKCFGRMAASNSYLRSVTGHDISYNTIYTSSSAVSKMVIGNALLMTNPQTSVVLYDDGIGSYSKNKKVLTGSALFQRAKSILHWKELDELAKEELLYQPELSDKKERTIKSMPSLELNDETRRTLQHIFCPQSQERIIINERVVIFDTFRKVQEQNETNKRLDGIYSDIVEICGYSEVILKDHPRSTVGSRADVKRFSYTAIPIEMVYLNQTDLEEKTLIALNSTAVFTPKMLFNQEPRIILLYRMGNSDKEIQKKRDELYLKMARIYTDASRICIPESYEELEHFLKEGKRHDDGA